MASLVTSKRLEGTAIEKLIKLISDAFSIDDLAKLVRIDLNSDLEDFTSKELNKPTIIFNVITALERKGDLSIFLQAVVNNKPQQSELRAYIERYCLIIDNFPPASASSLANASKSAIPPSPYPGLAYFGPADSRLFFGRDHAIGRLVDAVSQHALTALVGASGSGKSSVVLAGLAPRLAEQGNWRFTHFRVGPEPDKNPFMALARALVPLFAAD